MIKGKRVLAWILVALLSLSLLACGNEDAPLEEETNTEDNIDTTEEPPIENEEDGEEEGEEEETSYSFIFSEMPVAAYKVTGLGVGRSESVNEEEILVEVEWEDDYYVNPPLIRLTPGENTFILFCMLGDDAGEYSISSSTIHSPSGSEQWSAITYTCLDIYFPDQEGFSRITRQDTDDYYIYNEETYGGSFFSLIDPWLDWLRFAEIYHPDQDDSIFVIDVAPVPYDENYDDIDGMISGMIKAFNALGGTLEEISVEEAVKEYNIEISQNVEVAIVDKVEEEEEVKEEEVKEEETPTNTATPAPQVSENPTPAPATPEPTKEPVHEHTWVSKTIHHEETGHTEQRVTGSEQVVVGYTKKVTYYCVEPGCSFTTSSYDEMDNHEWETDHGGTGSKVEDIPMYETRDVVENAWIVDSPAWDEIITTCSGCGATQ